MGACLSSVETAGGGGKRTSTQSDSSSDRRRPICNVISANGDLHNYTVPVTVSQVLQMEFPTLSPPSSSTTSNSNSAKFFVCNSDLLYYDDYIPALDAEDELQPDRIYFVLPASKLQYRITASDMAALAVKASRALALAIHKSSSNSKKPPSSSSSSSSFLGHGRHRRPRSNKTARISPFLEEEEVNISNNSSTSNTYQRISSSSDGYGGVDKYYQVDRNGLVVTVKKGFSDKTYPEVAALGVGVGVGGVSRSVPVTKLQRYSSRRAKRAGRSFRIRLTTIYEGSVLLFY